MMGTEQQNSIICKEAGVSLYSGWMCSRGR